MNILTIGLAQNTIDLFDTFSFDSTNRVVHLHEKDRALHSIKDVRNLWDWIILQGHDDPGHWKSILCALNANASNIQVTVLSSHIDGTRLKTPVCSMHSGKDKKMTVSRCAMQNLLQQEQDNDLASRHVELDKPAPIIFEYHAPCR